MDCQSLSIHFWQLSTITSIDLKVKDLHSKLGIVLRNKSALAVKCWVLFHSLEVGCKWNQIKSAGDLSWYNWGTNSELLHNN